MPASIKLYKQWEWGHCREICLTSEQLWGKGMGKSQWCQTRDRPAHSRLWGWETEGGKKATEKKRRKWRGWQANGGVGGGDFQKRSWWPQLWEQWIEKEFKTIFFLILWKLIKMAAAVAKAQEKNRVPESPQVLRLFLTQDTQRERTPLSLPIGTGLQPSWVWAVLDTDKTCWG